MYINLKIDLAESTSELINNIIKRELRDYFRLNLNVEIIFKWDRYLRSNGIRLTLNNIISYIINTLEFSISNGNYVVKINNKLNINEYNPDSLARLINYGNSEIKGTGIFSDAFKYLDRNINDIIYREVN